MGINVLVTSCVTMNEWRAVEICALHAQSVAQVAVDEDDLGGVVTSGKGPGAGVWVIADTTDRICLAGHTAYST